jgi:hypothetical protein
LTEFCFQVETGVSLELKGIQPLRLRQTTVLSGRAKDIVQLV